MHISLIPALFQCHHPRKKKHRTPHRFYHQIIPGRHTTTYTNRGMLLRLLCPITHTSPPLFCRALATMPRAPRPVRSGPSQGPPQRPELLVKELNTVDMPVTPAEDRAVMLRVLNDSFKRRTLDGLPFYQALLSGAEVETGVGYEGCVDTRIVTMVNNYPVAEKRERLQRIFKLYETGQRITEGEDEQIQLEQDGVKLSRDNVIPQHIVRSGIPKLSDIVPGLETHSIPNHLLNQVTQSRFNTLMEYLDELKPIAKHHPRLQNQAAFSQLSDLLMEINNQSNALISIDIEAHEMNQNTVTEIGISIYDPAKEATSIFPNFKNIHLLPEEHIRLRNGSFVADNKDKFLGGNSIILPQNNAVQLVQCLVDYYFVHRTVMGMKGILVGHNVGGDVQWLESLGVEFPTDMKIVDTQTLFGLTHGQNNSSLGGILRRYDIPHAYLHNAGNDAYYTLILAMKLGDPQFRRWQGVDSFKEEEVYLQKLESRKLQQGDPFKGSRASKPRSAKVKKNNEVIVPVKFSSFSGALAEVFRPAGGAR